MVLAGPPGVGKTSLGESVARALGRKFVRVALGGVRDEAEIRGHRRTYVGALPGRIVRAIGEAGSMNPVVLLDEIDKVGSDYRGDPSAALLEVLDPAQNHTFRDHYLDLDLDLSDVVFLATANVIENIPSALLDRMELVAIDGYTEDDKVAIAREYLLPRQRERAALTAEEVAVTDAALRKIAADYTREPGVRQFERLLAKALRKVTTKIAEDGPVTIDEPDLVDYLGRPRFTPESAERTAVPGVATGLAVTGLGGDVLYIEAGATDGEPGLQLTGQLGDVMKESAQIALSYVRSHAAELGCRPQGAGPAHPRARACRRCAQGWSVGRGHDGHRAGVDGHRTSGPLRCRHDRRGHAERPGAADRRCQAEAAGRPTCRFVNGFHPGAQRAGPGRCASRGARGARGQTDDRCGGDRRAGIGTGGADRYRRGLTLFNPCRAAADLAPPGDGREVLATPRVGYALGRGKPAGGYDLYPTFSKDAGDEQQITAVRLSYSAAEWRDREFIMRLNRIAASAAIAGALTSGALGVGAGLAQAHPNDPFPPVPGCNGPGVNCNGPGNPLPPGQRGAPPPGHWNDPVGYGLPATWTPPNAPVPYPVVWNPNEQAWGVYLTPNGAFVRYQ